MAQYQQEIVRWSSILLDKILLDGAFDDKGPLDLMMSHFLSKIPDELPLMAYYELFNLPRKRAAAILSVYLREGILEKLADETDQRKRKLRKTEKGKLLSRRYIETYEERMQRSLSGLTVNDEVGVLKFISKLNQLTVEKYELNKNKKESDQ